MSVAMELEIALEEANPLMGLEDSLVKIATESKGFLRHTRACDTSPLQLARSQIAPVQGLERMNPSRQNSRNKPPMKCQMKYPI